MENITEQENLKRMYNILDWIDLGLVGVIVLYYMRLWNRLQYELPDLLEMDYVDIFNLVIENTRLTGIILLLISLVVTSVFIYLTIRMRKARCVGRIRTGIRLIWNGFFILFDIYALLMILIFRLTG